MKLHFQCLNDLKDAQKVDSDNRDKSREADHFLNKRDGQWEPDIVEKFTGKPRYTMDECNPVIDDIMGEMESMDFDMRVRPSGGQASKHTARVFEGIVRNIENISSARFIYNAAGRIMVGTGMSAWRVVQAYRDDDSFNQDLMIKKIPDVQNSVWFDTNATEQDQSDAEFCWVLTSMSKMAYDKEYPEGSGMSVGDSRSAQAYSYKKEEVIIGEYLYRKKSYRELALLSNGAVHVVDKDFNDVRAELLAQDIKVEQTRKRPVHTVYQKIMDGKDFLTDAKETVFEFLPIIPVFGNFRISEGKIIYWGATEKLMDPQRIINYSESRNVEESALAPRGKMWMRKSQAISLDVKKGLRTLNTNSDPVQFYDDDPDNPNQPPPAYMGAPAANPALTQIAQSGQGYIQRTSGTFDEARGKAPTHRSGEAIDKLQAKSDNPKRKWFTSMEIALSHTCRILVKAIPKVYDTMQEMNLVNPDGTSDTITIHQPVVDEETGKTILLHNLAVGQYDVICKAGPAFHSRQQETVSTINEIAVIDPSIMQLGGDVLLNNINAPGIEQIAERKRAQMLQQGLIPESQMTEEEKEQMAEQQEAEGDKPDPMDIIAQAEMTKAQTDADAAASKAQIEQAKVVLQKMKLQLEGQKEAFKLEQADRKQHVETMLAMSKQLKAQAEVLKLIREAIGADAMVTPAAVNAFNSQARELNEDVRTQ